ncbi:unnamed protein product [Lota lota]
MDLFRFEAIFLLLSVGVCAVQGMLPQGPLYVLLGKSVTFQTSVDLTKPFVTIMWSFKSPASAGYTPLVSLAGSTENVAPGYAGRTSLNHTTGTLVLGAATLADTGDYSVAMIDSMAVTQTGQTTLRVLAPVSSVQITPTPLEALETNSTVVLNCSALGSFLRFTWTNGTGPLGAGDQRITFDNRDQWSSVTIREVRRWELGGPIYCTATNKLETAVSSAPFNMSVHYGPEAVLMTVQPAASAGGVVRKGSNVTLSCSAVSSPPATLSWFHNGAALPGKTGPTLVLSDLSKTQGGKYHCSAHNAKTLRTGDALATSFSVMEAISGAKVTGPEGELTAGSASVNLTCAAAVGAATAAAWTKGDKPLAQSERVALAANGTLLTIWTLRKEDRGEYRCTLTNAVNSDSATYRMEVFYGPDDVAISGRDAVEVNENLNLTCNADSNPPAEVKWRFNDTALEENTSVLTIAEATYQNAGVYTCEALNAKTRRNASDTFLLSVKALGELDESLTGGQIAGIVIGVLAGLLVVICCCICCNRKQPCAKAGCCSRASPLCYYEPCLALPGPPRDVSQANPSMPPSHLYGNPAAHQSASSYGSDLHSNT